MNLDQFLVSKQPLERQVTLPDGSTHTLYFLEPTAADMRRWHFDETSDDENRRMYAAQELIAACLYDPKEKRRVFDGPDLNKHKELSITACKQLLAPILDIANATQQKKTSL